MADVQVRSDLCNPCGKSSFTMYGRETLDTGGGTQVVLVPGAKIGDVVILSLESDDTGTPITKLVGSITVSDIPGTSTGTLTIVRTDDGSSNDDAVCSYIIIRPNE